MTRYRSHHEMCAEFAPFIIVLLHQWFIKYVLCRPNMKGYLQISDTGKFMGLIIYVSRLIVDISLVDVGFSCKRSVAVCFSQYTLSFFNVRDVFSCRQLVSVILMFFVDNVLVYLFCVYIKTSVSDGCMLILNEGCLFLSGSCWMFCVADCRFQLVLHAECRFL